MPQFLLRGLTWAVLHVWTQNYPQNVDACSGLLLQLLARNPFSKVIGLNPPKVRMARIFLKDLSQGKEGKDGERGREG